MRRLIGKLLFTVASVCVISCSSSKKYTSANAHSHNDYENSSPFVHAFRQGFGSIEADVFPVNGELFVAHDKKNIQQRNTLKALYLEPLLAELTADSLRKLNLLIDIKENYQDALPILQKELQPLLKYLSTTAEQKNVTVSISGERPPPTNYSEYPNYIFFDNDLKQKHSPQEWNRVNLVSLQFDKISTWKGEGVIPKSDLQKLKHVVDSVHSAGKPIRFWAAPDTEEAWKQQMKLHVDLIGTDKIDKLSSYLKEGTKR